MNVKISNYDNLEQKFHLPVSFQVTLTLQAKTKLHFSKQFKQEHTLGAHSDSKAFSRLPGVRVGPREVPRESGGPSYERDGGGAHCKRLCQAGKGGKGTKQENTAKKGLGRQTPSLGSEHCPHTAGATPPPNPRCSPRQAPPLRHHRVTPSVPALGNRNLRGPWGADTHLAEPHRELGPPSRTTAATGAGGPQRASQRPIPSRPIPQVPLNTRSPLSPPAPSFPSPAGAPELAGMRAPGTNTRSALTQLGSCPSSLPTSRSLR